MFAPGPIGMLFMFLLALGVYLLLSALFLRLASRWVLKTWLPWKLTLKVVLVNLIVLLIVNFILALIFAGAGLMPMMGDDPLFNLISFIFSMAASAYVYGHWISVNTQEEPIGFGHGLLIYWAQLLIILATALLLGLIVGLIAAVTRS